MRYRAAVVSASLLVWSSVAQAQTKTTRLSEPVSGQEATANDNGFPDLSLSADGKIAVFVSGRANLVPNDTNDSSTGYGSDVFIRDVAAASTKRIMGVGGEQANGDATAAALTRDGRYVFFASHASNLVANDPNGPYLNNFRHDLVTGVTTLIDMPAGYIRISSDGRYLAFHFNTAKVLDLQSGITTDLFPGASGSDFHFNGDGGVVAFYSGYVEGVYAGGGPTQVFVLDRGTGNYELISRRPDGSPGSGGSGYGGIAISDDGRYVAFESIASDLVANDTNGVADVFVHDRVTHETTRVSVTATGAERTAASASPAISPNGAVVGFVSSAPAECAGCPPLTEIAVYDRTLSKINIVSVATDGTPSNQPSTFVAPMAMDHAGRYVAFGSHASNLVPGDTNRAEDLFLRDRGPTPGCTYEASPTVIDAGSDGGTVAVTISTAAGCGWSAAIADPWVTASIAGGTGPSTVSLTIAPNAGISRFGYLAFEGRRLLVRQPGALASAPPQFEPVDQAPDGSSFARGTFVGAITGDGRYVAFTGSLGSSFSIADITRVYLRDRTTGRTIDVSGAPGGPPDDPATTHNLAGTWSADFGVSFVTGSSISVDGRFVYFRSRNYSTTLGCFLFDRDTGTSIKLPDGLGYGDAAGCPSMTRDARYFSGILPGTRTIVLYDRSTQQRAEFTFPGLSATQGVGGVITSVDARYVLVRVSEYAPGCFSSSLACIREHSILLDRVTGVTARTTATGFNTSLQPRLRLLLVDPLWMEFGLSRYHSRLDDTLAACELLDRQTGHRQALPLLNTFSYSSAPDCGTAVNDGQQVIFSTLLDLSPGDIYQTTYDLHVYTLSSGRAARLGSRVPGQPHPLYTVIISQNGRYLLTSTYSAPYNTDGVSGVAVLDLGIASSEPVGTATPSNLRALVNGSTVVLTWTAPSQGTPTSYLVEAGHATGMNNLAQLETGNTATTLTAVAPPGTFYIRVRARIGGTLGSASNEVIATVGGACASPPTPVGLIHSVAGTAVSLAWQAAPGATRYVIDVGTSAGLSNLVSLDTGSGATSFAAAGPAGTYYVRVRARNACGTSNPSNETVVVVGGGCATPSAPASLTATVSGTAVSLAWTPTAGSVLGYVLDVGTSPGTINLGQFPLGAGASLTAAAPLGTYYVRVRARNACGVGPASNEAIVTVR